MKRIQRRRTKGWRMPEGTVYVGRPSRWGNPWTTAQMRAEFGYYFTNENGGDAALKRYALQDYRTWLAGTLPEHWNLNLPERPDLSSLRGRDLACWCPIVDGAGNPVPCHADILLELANQ